MSRRCLAVGAAEPDEPSHQSGVDFSKLENLDEVGQDQAFGSHGGRTRTPSCKNRARSATCRCRRSTDNSSPWPVRAPERRSACPLASGCAEPARPPLPDTPRASPEATSSAPGWAPQSIVRGRARRFPAVATLCASWANGQRASPRPTDHGHPSGVPHPWQPEREGASVDNPHVRRDGLKRVERRVRGVVVVHCRSGDCNADVVSGRLPPEGGSRPLTKALNRTRQTRRIHRPPSTSTRSSPPPSPAATARRSYVARPCRAAPAHAASSSAPSRHDT